MKKNSNSHLCGLFSLFIALFFCMWSGIAHADKKEYLVGNCIDSAQNRFAWCIRYNDHTGDQFVVGRLYTTYGSIGYENYGFETLQGHLPKLLHLSSGDEVKGFVNLLFDSNHDKYFMRTFTRSGSLYSVPKNEATCSSSSMTKLTGDNDEKACNNWVNAY